MCKSFNSSPCNKILLSGYLTYAYPIFNYILSRSLNLSPLTHRLITVICINSFCLLCFCTHIFLLSSLQSKSIETLPMSPTFPSNTSWQGTSRPPCSRSLEYLWAPTISHEMIPRCQEQIVAIFLGTWPITMPSFFTATTNRLVVSLMQDNILFAGIQKSLEMLWSQTADL